MESNEIKILKLLLIITIMANNIENDNLIYKQVNNYQKLGTNSLMLKIFIIANKDFNSLRYNPIYSIVVDHKMQLKNNYSLNIIYANEGKLFGMRKSYAEMSKIYFIYQLYKKGNISSKYIGFNHYRRYFVFKDNIPYIEDIFKDYDVILNKQFHLNMTVKKQYCSIHICKIYDVMLDIIKKIKPDYYKTAIKTSKERKIYFCNLFIMKKEDFFKYCEFLFDILFEFDKRNNFTSDNDVINYLKSIYNDSDKISYQTRIQGFLSERISNIFFRHNFKRIKTFDTEM